MQRGGPSTGLPTKTEQADLLLAMYGRHGEAPLPIVAAQSPADCFDAAFEAVRIALKYRTPVILLTDGYLANGAEPWMLPDLDALPDISVPFATEPNHGDEFWPYLRDPETLARPWAIPGTPGLMHRVGGLEKEDGTGNISYDPENHDTMTRIRAAKIAGIANDIPLVDLDDPGRRRLPRACRGAARGARRPRRCAASAARGTKIAHAHLRHMNPFPADLGDVVRRYSKILVPEMNLGQLSKLVRAEFLVDAQSYAKMSGVPFHAAELEEQDPGDDAVVTEGNGNGDGSGAGVKLARKDFQSDQEVRWCPGCGDYGILTAIQLLLPETGIKPEDLVFVSGIGCAARLPYYMNTYGIHCIHGRAPAVATGVALARPDLARVGHRRRRRHAVDRRQPPDPRAAPQREPEDPDVQQPDLRPHQGPVLADERDRQGHEVDAVRFARPPVQPDLGRARRGGDASSPARTTWTAST